MPDKIYSLNQIKKYAASKVSKAVGYTFVLVAGSNLIYDAIQRDADAATAFNIFAVLGGLVVASGLEDKLMNRTKIVKEITDKTGY